MTKQIKKPAPVLIVCPVCGMETDFCEHFVGWLSHADFIVRWDRFPPMGDTDLDTYDEEKHHLVSTPITTRVYRRKTNPRGGDTR